MKNPGLKSAYEISGLPAIILLKLEDNNTLGLIKRIDVNPKDDAIKISHDIRLAIDAYFADEISYDHVNLE